MKISVIITSYNHENYIAQCVESVLSQKGDFEMEIIVGDDCSTDNTPLILQRYQQTYPDIFRILPTPKNLGITRNLKRCLDACTGELIAICEGDDYWTKPYKLQKQMEFLVANPDFALCFSTLTLYYVDEERFTLYSDQVEFPRDEITIYDLIDRNLIGNFSCCMYRTSAVRQLSPKMFEFFTVDWMFNMACSEIGRVGFIRESMSVYRKHSSGAWTGKPEVEQLTELLVLIDTYNHFLEYRYHKNFMKFKKLVELGVIGRFGPEVANQVFHAAAQRSQYPPPPELAAQEVEAESDLAAEEPVVEEPEVAPEPEPEKPTIILARRWPEEPSLQARYRLLVWFSVVVFKNIFRPYWRALIRIRNQAREGTLIPLIWRLRLASFRRDPLKPARRAMRYLLNMRKFRDTDLLILDTVFPHPLSPFRFHEFKNYLDSFPKAKVFTNGDHLPLLAEKRSIGKVVAEFESRFPQWKNRVVFDEKTPRYINGKLAYATFLNNIKGYLPILEEKQIPFVFTLYPGGGFQIDQPESDIALKRIFSSPQFRKVFATQRMTYNYLIQKNYCRPDQIEFIYGVVTPQTDPRDLPPKRHFGFEKETLDICFVAYKYSERGIDKGYDVFVETARALASLHDNIHFHVVGNFDANDIPVDDLKDHITFYGVQQRSWFTNFFADKDIILSPNVAFVLRYGAFDGFPTSSCTDAGLQEVAMFCTDDLFQNFKFTDREEIVIIPHDPLKITEMIDYYYQRPAELRTLACRGAAKILDIYSDEKQIDPRKKILAQEISRGDD